jgi:nitrite reductase (NO-forming)
MPPTIPLAAFVVGATMTGAFILLGWVHRIRSRHESARVSLVAEAEPSGSRLTWMAGALAVMVVGTLGSAMAARSPARAVAGSQAAAAAPATTMDMGSMPMPMPMPAAAPAAASGPGTGTPVVATAAAAPRGPVVAEIPPVAQGRTARFTITAQDAVVPIAHGVTYRAWTFNGRVPGPVMHVRQGQRVVITFRNATSMPHSLDLHAASVPADVAFADIGPGKSTTISFTASAPGAFLYHCVTAPGLMHIGNGMFGALVVDPATPLPHAAHTYVLVANEWYLNGTGTKQPASLDWTKAMAMQPDYLSFNGYANEYADHPLHVRPHQRLRFYVVNAGPNLVTPFHLVGGLFERAYTDGDMRHWLNDVQTTDVAPGGSAAFDTRFDEPGVYGFVSHSFANVEKGELGAIDVGNVTGTMTH